MLPVTCVLLRVDSETTCSSSHQCLRCLTTAAGSEVVCMQLLCEARTCERQRRDRAACCRHRWSSYCWWGRCSARDCSRLGGGCCCWCNCWHNSIDCFVQVRRHIGCVELIERAVSKRVVLQDTTQHSWCSRSSLRGPGTSCFVCLGSVLLICCCCCCSKATEASLGRMLTRCR